MTPRIWGYQDLVCGQCARCGLIFGQPETYEGHGCVKCYGLNYDFRVRRHRNDRGQFAAIPVDMQQIHNSLLHGYFELPMVSEWGPDHGH